MLLYKNSPQFFMRQLWYSVIYPHEGTDSIKKYVFLLQALLSSQRTFVPGDHVAVPGTSEKISF